MSAIVSYGQQLSTNDFSANAILFVITDGCDNASKLPAKRVKEALKRLVTSEALESVISILIGVNVQDSMVSNQLRAFQRDAGFTQYVELDNADTDTLARLAHFVSQSILAHSQLLGAGSVSQSLVF